MLIKIPKTRAECATLLKAKGWKLVYQEKFMCPSRSFEIWEKSRYAYQLRLCWPLDPDEYATEIEIEKAVNRIQDAECEEQGFSGGNRWIT